MNQDQIKCLSKMKKLIKEGKRRFVNRKDRDYLKELLIIGINEEEAWNYILSLNFHFYVPDLKPFGDSLIFKRSISSYIVYIKLKIELSKDREETICISFHRDL